MKTPSSDVPRQPAHQAGGTSSHRVRAKVALCVGLTGLAVVGCLVPSGSPWAGELEDRCAESDAAACEAAGRAWREGRVRPLRADVAFDLLLRACELDATRCDAFAEVARTTGRVGEGLSAGVRGCLGGVESACDRAVPEVGELAPGLAARLVDACMEAPAPSRCRAAARARWLTGAWAEGDELWAMPCGRRSEPGCGEAGAERRVWEARWLEREHAEVEEELSLRWSAWSSVAPGDPAARTAIQAIAADPRYGAGTLRGASQERPIQAGAWLDLLRWLEQDAQHRPGGYGYPLARVAGGMVKMDGARRRVATLDVGRHEVTQGLFEKVMGWQPVSRDGCEVSRGDAMPVVCVSWLEAVQFANTLSTREQLRPAYQITEVGVRRVEGSDGYRLPTEAEWVFLAAPGRYPGGVARARLCEVGNVADLSAGRRWPAWPVERCDDGYAELAPVGSFRSDRRGLHDLVGNVREWTEDVVSGGRALRGGAWLHGADLQRTDARAAAPEGYQDAAVGLRLVRDVPGGGPRGAGPDR